MGFLDCLGRGGGCQVSQFVAGGPGGSLSVETSGGWGYLQFSLGLSPGWWWRSPSNHFPQSPVPARPSCEQSPAVRWNQSNNNIEEVTAAIIHDHGGRSSTVPTDIQVRPAHHHPQLSLSPDD